MKSSLLWGNRPVMFSSNKLVKIEIRRCECIHRWFRVCHKINHVRIKEKPALLGQFQTVKGFWPRIIAFISFIWHTSHKTWKIYGKSQGSWLFFQVVVSSPTGKHFTVLRLKTLFLQLRDFQNIGARLWQHEFHWRELWGNGWWMDQGDSTNCIIPI